MDISQSHPLPTYHRDLFHPALRSAKTPAATTTGEQLSLIQEVLNVSCSDSAFAAKAFAAISLILKGNVDAPPPTLTSLSPNTAVAGSGPMTLTVNGTGFDATSQIYVNGNPLPTTYVSVTSLSADVDLTAVLAAATIPVAVVNGASYITNTMQFTVTVA